MALNDGPSLEAMKKLNGALLREPGREKDRADRDRLADRYARFKAAA